VIIMIGVEEIGVEVVGIALVVEEEVEAPLDHLTGVLSQQVLEEAEAEVGRDVNLVQTCVASDGTCPS
jgi:hypothetical protein